MIEGGRSEEWWLQAHKQETKMKRGKSKISLQIGIYISELELHTTMHMQLLLKMAVICVVSLSLSPISMGRSTALYHYYIWAHYIRQGRGRVSKSFLAICGGG